jgi:hypothetical protein
LTFLVIIRAPAVGRATTVAKPAFGLAAGTYTGTQTVTITAINQANTGMSASASVTLKATPTVSAWPADSSITYGQTLESSILSGGTTSVPGTFVRRACKLSGSQLTMVCSR